MEQSITLKIAGNTYSLKAATPESEHLMRVAAAEVNAMLSKFDARFPDKSVEDKLAFVALQETMGKLSYQKKLASTKDEVDSLNAEVSAYLEGTK